MALSELDDDPVEDYVEAPELEGAKDVTDLPEPAGGIDDADLDTLPAEELPPVGSLFDKVTDADIPAEIPADMPVGSSDMPPADAALRFPQDEEDPVRLQVGEQFDDEDDLDDGLAGFGRCANGAPEELPEESWEQRLSADVSSSTPSQLSEERLLWERVRSSAVRREAAHVQSLKLPAAVLARLVALHPELRLKTGEAMELINYSAVLMVQAVAKAAARDAARAIGGGKCTRVQFKDIRKVCLESKELQFLQPLNGTLDPTALMLRRGDYAAEGADVGFDEDGHLVNAATASKKVVGRQARGKPMVEGQSRLGVSAFAKSAGPALATDDAEEALDENADPNAAEPGEATPDRCQEAEQAPAQPAARGKKRAAPTSTEKASAKKAPRKPAAGGKKTQAAPAAAGGGLGRFFTPVAAPRPSDS